MLTLCGAHPHSHFDEFVLTFSAIPADFRAEFHYCNANYRTPLLYYPDRITYYSFEDTPVLSFLKLPHQSLSRGERLREGQDNEAPLQRVTYFIKQGRAVVNFYVIIKIPSKSRAARS